MVGSTGGVLGERITSSTPNIESASALTRQYIGRLVLTTLFAGGSLLTLAACQQVVGSGPIVLGPIFPNIGAPVDPVTVPVLPPAAPTSIPTGVPIPTDVPTVEPTRDIQSEVKNTFVSIVQNIINGLPVSIQSSLDGANVNLALFANQQTGQIVTEQYQVGQINVVPVFVKNKDGTDTVIMTSVPKKDGETVKTWVLDKQKTVSGQIVFVDRVTGQIVMKTTGSDQTGKTPSDEIIVGDFDGNNQFENVIPLLPTDGAYTPYVGTATAHKTGDGQLAIELASNVAAPTGSPTAVPTLTARGENIPTYYPSFVTKGKTDVYGGPSNFNFSRTTSEAGLKMQIPYKYGDYYQVTWKGTDGKVNVGYVLIKQVGSIADADSIPQLPADQVPWQVLKTIGSSQTFTGPKDSGRGEQTLMRFNADGNTRVDFQMKVNNLGIKDQSSAVHWYIGDSNKNFTDVLVGVSGEDKNWNFSIRLKDGTKLFYKILPISLSTTEYKFSLEISSDGRNLSLYSSDGTRLATYNSPQFSVFDTGKTVDTKVKTAPQSQITIGSMSVLGQPSGKLLAEAPNIDVHVDYPKLPGTNISPDYRNEHSDLTNVLNQDWGGGFIASKMRPQAATIENGYVQLNGLIDSKTGKTGIVVLRNDVEFFATVNTGSDSNKIKVGDLKEISFYHSDDQQNTIDAINNFIAELNAQGITNFSLQISNYPNYTDIFFFY